MWSKQRKQEQVIWFTRQFYVLNKAGMGFGFSLKTLQKSCTDKKLSVKIRGILKEIERGQPFSKGLACYPDLFDHFYIQMVHVGEQTGKLTEILHELQIYWERRQRFWRDVLRALLYPTVVMVMMLILTFGLCFTVIPKFEQIFASFQAPLPWATRLLFTSVGLFKQYFMWIGLAAALGFWGGKRLLQSWFVQFMQNPAILRVLMLGQFYHISLLYKFFKVLGIALKAGLSLQEAMKMLHKMFEGTPFKQVISLVEYDLKNGRRLADIFNRPQYFPEICQGFFLWQKKPAI